MEQAEYNTKIKMYNNKKITNIDNDNYISNAKTILVKN